MDMRKVSLLLVFAIASSACSSQRTAWIAGQVWDAIDPTPNSYATEYDESAIFPTPNERLACQMDSKCKKPMSKAEFERLSEKEKILAKYGNDAI